MNLRYRVKLSQAERDELKALIGAGKHPVRKLKRAQTLLAADAGASDEDIAIRVGIGRSTVYRTKRRFVLSNLEAALSEEPRPGIRPALYEAFPACEARRVLERLEFHYVPKHASWLNMVEIDIGMLRANASTAGSGRASASNPKSSPGTIAKCRTRRHQIDVHNRQGTNQNGARLSLPNRRSELQTQRVIVTVQGY